MEAVTFKVTATTSTGLSFPIQFWAQHVGGEVKTIYTTDPDTHEDAPRECYNAFKADLGVTLELSMDIWERATLAANNSEYRI